METVPETFNPIADLLLGRKNGSFTLEVKGETVTATIAGVVHTGHISFLHEALLGLKPLIAAEIEGLEDQISFLEGDNETWKDRCESYQEEIAELEEQNSDLEATNVDLKAARTSLEAQVSALSTQGSHLPSKAL
jgi:predicted nuclease with TOPRIM domain